jgi:hypothetical protein
MDFRPYRAPNSLMRDGPNEGREEVDSGTKRRF